MGLIVTASLSSCGTNWLDESPSDGIPADGALNSTEALASARVGLYKSFKGDHNLTDYYAREIFTYGDVRGEDIQYNHITGSSRGSFQYYMTYATADQFNSSNSTWLSPYVVIGRANRIINSGLTDEQSVQYENEAKVIRAYALFDLTRIYGVPYTKDNGASLGVPFSTTALNAEEKLPRSTVSDCYKQVLVDLNDAIASGTLETGKTPGYINIWAAKALLTRVYLTMGDWDKALSTAEDIIEHSPYKLWTASQYASAWNENDGNHGNEMIFEFVITNTTDWTDREGIAYLYRENDSKVASGYGDLIASKKFVDMLTSDPQDVRNDILVASDTKQDKAVYGDNKVFLDKFPAINGDVRYDDVPMLRLSEVYLSAAEAAFNAGNKEKAAKYLNDIIRNRTTDASKVVTAADVTLDRIYVERRKELVGEGQRYFDVLRRGETVVRYTNDADRGWNDILKEDARTFNRDSKKALPLIPQDEINANPEIVQNPLY